MTFIQVIFQRYISTSPKLFKYVTWLAVILFCIAQALLWMDNKVDIVWINEGWRSLLDDVCTSSASIALTSGVTTKDKSLQKETETVLAKKD